MKIPFMINLILVVLLLSGCELFWFLNNPQTKELPAVKIETPPKIDGNLDDAAWKNAPLIQLTSGSTLIVGTPEQAKTHGGQKCHS